MQISDKKSCNGYSSPMLGILVIKHFIYEFLYFDVLESVVEEESSFSENQPFPSLKMVSSLRKAGCQQFCCHKWAPQRLRPGQL